MSSRLTFVAVALLVAAGVTGCTEKETKIPQPDAHVTINDQTRTTHSVQCSQVDWMLTIGVHAGPASVTTVVRLGGEKPVASSVNIDNFLGFSGSAAEAANDHLNVSVASGRYTITGTAKGFNPHDPSQPASTNFKIEANC